MERDKLKKIAYRKKKYIYIFLTCPFFFQFCSYILSGRHVLASEEEKILLKGLAPFSVFNGMINKLFCIYWFTLVWSIF